MPTARIITRFPERAASLRKTLSDSGYRVEVVPPDCHPKGPADVEYDLDDSLEFVAEEAPQPEREFVFASQWRALTSLFAAREDKDAAPVAVKPAPPNTAKSPAPASSSDLDQHFVDRPASGPSFAERIAALRAPLAQRFDALKTDLQQQKQEMARKFEATRTAAAEKRRIAAADAATRRAAELAAAERHRAESQLRQQEQQQRDAARNAELQAQLEIRRQQQAEELERARFAAQERARQQAEQRTRLEAERLLAAAVIPAASVAAPVMRENRRSWQRLHDMRDRSLAKWNEWRQLRPSAAFANTRQYAWRQAMPVAAGIAIAFVIGWAAATSGSYRGSTPKATDTVAAPTAAPVAAIVPAPIHAPKALKPSPVAHKATVAMGKNPVRRSRRSPDEETHSLADAAEGGDDVTVIHHYPGKPNFARNKKGGVKTISDME